MSERPIYLDHAATTPVDPRVAEVVMHYMVEEFGNAGSRTHEYGSRARKAVDTAREQVAAVVEAKPDEVIFTSGATESNNLAILGLAPFGEREGRRHILSTMIEHKAVLEPLAHLEKRGFEVELVRPTRGGWVEADDVLSRVRDDTLLVSVMHVNNETGVIQPIDEVAAGLEGRSAYFHVDAAQGYSKELQKLKHKRIDMISVSGHKIYAPKGVGALITRRRNRLRPPLEPLMFGGGQERGLRPGTVAVPLVVGLGVAAQVSTSGRESGDTRRKWERAVSQIEGYGGVPLAEVARVLPGILCVAFPGVDAESLTLAVRGRVAISVGSACTSGSHEPSHVLTASGVDVDLARSAVRFSLSGSLTDSELERALTEVGYAVSELSSGGLPESASGQTFTAS